VLSACIRHSLFSYSRHTTQMNSHGAVCLVNAVHCRNFTNLHISDPVGAMADFPVDDIPRTIKRYINEPLYRNEPSFLHLFHVFYKQDDDINVIFLMYLKSIGKYHYFVYACLARHFLRINEPGKALFVLQEGILNDCIGKDRLMNIKCMIDSHDIDHDAHDDVLPASVRVFGREWIQIAVNYAAVDVVCSALERKAKDYLEKLSWVEESVWNVDELSGEELLGDGRDRKRRKSIVEMVCVGIEEDWKNERSIVEDNSGNDGEDVKECEMTGNDGEKDVKGCEMTGNDGEKDVKGCEMTGNDEEKDVKECKMTVDGDTVHDELKNGEKSAFGSQNENKPTTDGSTNVITPIKLFGEEYFCSPEDQNVESVDNVAMEKRSLFKLSGAMYIVKEIENDHVVITSIENLNEEHTFTSREYVLKKVCKTVDLEMIRAIIPHELVYIRINGQLYTKYVKPFLYTLGESEQWLSSNICAYFVREMIKILRLVYMCGLCVELSLCDFNVEEEDEQLVLKLNNLNFGDRMRFDALELMVKRARIATSENPNDIEESAWRRIRQMNLADEFLEYKLRLLGGINYK
ncbi:hypothetical protein THOM_1012, partial [Trachipleistophora hominis]